MFCVSKSGPRCHFRDARVDGKMSNMQLEAVPPRPFWMESLKTHPRLHWKQVSVQAWFEVRPGDSPFWNWEALVSIRATNPN